MTTEAQDKALAAIKAGRSTIAELHAELGDISEWKTLDELTEHIEAGRALGGLVVTGLAYISFPFREPARYCLTAKGRAALKAST